MDTKKIYQEAYKSVYNSYFSKLSLDKKKNLKIPENYKEYKEKGVDKLIISIPYTAYSKDSLERLEKRGWSTNIRGHTFSKLIAGVKNKSFWSYLEINPSKVLYRDNVRNVRSKVLLNKIVRMALEEIGDYGYSIDISHCFIHGIEVNEIIILNQKTLNQKTITIITDELSQGHYKRKSSLHKESLDISGFSVGTKNKSITGYDKTLEVIYQDMKKGKLSRRKIPMKELREASKGYPVFFRLETKSRGEPLKNLVDKRLLMLDTFLKDPAILIDLIFDRSMKEAGLTEEGIHIVNAKRVKNLSRKLKRYIKMYERGFITHFLKDYQSQIWGVEQLYDLVDHITLNKNDKYNRKKSFLRNYKQIKNVDNIHLDGYEYLKSFIENI